MSMLQDFFGLDGKVALVTGAGQGLGKGYALYLAQAGAFVVCFGRKPDSLQKVVQEIESAGGTAAAIVGDITSKADIDRTVAEILGRFGKIDILVNNAGTEIPKDFNEVAEDEFDRIMAVNLKGTYRMCQAVTASMKERKAGKIINIGSLGSYIGLAGSTVYCCSKGAILQFTKALAIEMAPYHIQVNAIAPGYFRTAMTEPFFQDKEHCAWINDRIPLGRVGTEEDLGGVAVFLASRASDYITGQTVIVDGGWLAS